ncbi:unnamed protein product [Adineta ricciae]|uniref:G-protein coupled receptors family 1 profile domain-containing protein n=1 Tax=Adineta ricciae TaxID=249248 RepID=A0A813QDT3_ADIRI|nr:unnamed protein product [Adineta ricciae]CAF1004288.1 unnamed protein product [Adineta ricciae]
MNWTRTNLTGTLVDNQPLLLPQAGSFLSTTQLVISTLSPFLELARIILSIITFLLVHFSPLYRTTSFGLHIRCLAVYEACRIIERLFYWFPPLSLFMPRYKYTRCNLAFFLQNYFSHLSVVTIVLLSIERCIILWSPFRARYLTTMRNALIEELINMIAMFIVTHFYLVPNYFASMDFSRCFYSKIFHIYHLSLVFDYKFYAIADIILFSLLPCSLTTISIVLIIIGLKRHKRHQKYLRANGQEQQQQQLGTSIYETSIILIAIAILQVTTTFPLRMLLLLRYFIPIDLDFYTGLYYILSFNELLASALTFIAFVLPFQNSRTECTKVFFAFCFFQRQRSSTTASTLPRIAVVGSGNS